MRSGLEESLQLNGIDPRREDLGFLFSELNSDMRAGDSVVIVSFTDSTGIDRILVQTLQSTREAHGEALGVTLWKVWFGITPDSGGEALKRALLGIPGQD